MEKGLEIETALYYNIACGSKADPEKIALSPNGKATDSDSVIFKVRILVALRKKSLDDDQGIFCVCYYILPEDLIYRIGPVA